MEQVYIDKEEVIEGPGKRAVTNTTSQMVRLTMSDGTYGYYVECLDHGQSKPQPHRQAATESMRKPYRVCEVCAEESGMAPPKEIRIRMDAANAGICDGCGQLRQPTTLYGHLQVPKRKWVRLCKECQSPENPARKGFLEKFKRHFEAWEKQWDGMSKAERQRAAARLVIGSWRTPKFETEDSGADAREDSEFNASTIAS